MEAVGLASGVLALTQFALQSSVALYQCITDIQNSPKSLRELKRELEALEAILKALEDWLSEDPSSFPALRLPILRCAEACQDFMTLIKKSTTRSTDQTTSLRDWAKLKYKGNDVAGFKDTLSTYRLTIAVALGHANLQVTRITADALDKYKEMVIETTLNLKEQLEMINEKLGALAINPQTTQVAESDERRDLRIEKQITEQCLAICEDVSAQVAKYSRSEMTRVDSLSSSNGRQLTTRLAEDRTVAEELTQAMLQEFLKKSHGTAMEIRTHLNAIVQRLNSQPLLDLNITSGEQERQSFLNDKKSLECCLDVCAEASRRAEQARTNVFEDISSSSEGQQIIVSTVGDLVNAKGVKAGPKTSQWLGQMSDESLQQLSTAWKHTRTAGKSKHDEDTQISPDSEQ